MSTAGIQRGVPGTFVYLVKADSTVSVRPVKLGVTDGDRVEVLSGLQPGDRIVIDGADKLREGAKVIVRAEADANQPGRGSARPGRRQGRRRRQEAAFRTARQEATASRRSGRAKTMSPSQPFILRPVATTLLMIAIMLSGMLAFRFLPLAALPEVDYPTIQVQTFYPGASPDVMTSSVTAPLEVQFGQMPNLNQMSSISSAGASVITLQFGLTISLDVAEQEVQAAINAAGNLLPSDLPAPPIYAKVNPADAPILTLGLTSKTMPLTAGRGFRRHAAGAEDLAAARRRPRQHSAAASGRRCASRPTSASSRPTASTSTICAPPSATPTSIRRRAISTARCAPTPSTPTTRSGTPTTTAR